MSRIILLISFLLVASGKSTSEVIPRLDLIKDKHRNTVTHSESPSVCLLCNTRLSITQWTENWTKKFLSYMDSVLIKSILRQCTDFSPCPSMKSFSLFILVDGHNDELDKFLEHVGEVTNLHIVVSGPRRNSRIRTEIAKIVELNDCNWLASIWIDADDAFLDGYFNYVTSIAGELLRTTTLDG